MHLEIKKCFLKAENDNLILTVTGLESIDGFTTDAVFYVDISNATYEKESIGSLIDPESYRFIQLANSIKRFGNDGYQDKSGVKEVYVLKRDLFGYEAGKKFFTRGDMLYPAGVSQDCIGFNKDIALELGYIEKPTQEIRVNLFSNFVGITHDPENLLSAGDFVKVNNIGIFQIESKSRATGMEKGYYVVVLK